MFSNTSWHALLKYFSKSNILLITDMFHHNSSPFYLKLWIVMVLRHFQVKSLYFIVTTNAFFFYLINHPILLTVFLSPSYPSHHFTIPPLSPSNPSHHLTTQPSNHLTIPSAHNPTLLTIPQSHPSHISLTDPLTISPSHP